MKKALVFTALLAVLFSLGLSTSRAMTNPDVGDAATLGAEPGGMPGWPVPDKPIPHNETGHPARASSYTSQVEILDGEGLMETVQLSGVDAMAADGLDPLAGNYSLVDLDRIMTSWSQNNQQSVQTFTSTLEIIPGSQFYPENYPSMHIAAGDLNNDGQSEQILAWIGGQNHIYLSTGEMPGSLGRTTSAPAAVAHGGTPADDHSLQFDGTSNYVETDDQINLANNSFTVAFWAKRVTPNRWDMIIGQGQEVENEGLHIGFRSNNKFTCGFYNNDLDTDFYTDTDWHHWACTYDAGTKLRTIYRDGVQVAQDESPADYQGSGMLYIGHSPCCSGIQGLVDQVGIWSTAYTQNQIRLDMVSSMPDAADLVAYWPFDEGAGTTTADVSGNGHDGTLVNSPVWNDENAPEGEPGDIHLLVRGYDEALWHCNYDLASDSCLNWDNSAGGILLSAPAVASLGEGQFDVFVVGTDNQVYRRHWHGTWIGGWQQYGTWPLPAASWVGPTPELPPLAALARGGGIDLFRLGPDNSLFWHDGTDWQSLGGMLASGPGAVSLGADHMQVFARGADEALWYLTYSSGSWGAWQRLELDGMDAGVTIASAPTAVSPGSGQVEVYVRGSNNQLWQITYNGTGWGTWVSLGGSLASGVAVAEEVIFAQAEDGSLQQGDGAVWTPLGGLSPCCAVYDTGLLGRLYPLTPGRDIEDYSLDVETGYFLGDGRSQIVLAYQDWPYNNVKIALFQTGGGFIPQVVAQVDPPHNSTWLKIATGDFLDGDGIDEVALAYVLGNSWAVDIIRLSGEEPGVVIAGDIETDNTGCAYSGMKFEGTLEVVSGDLDGDGQDEVAMTVLLYCDDYQEVYACKTFRYHFRTRIFDVIPGDDLITYKIEEDWRAEVHRDEDAWTVGLALAAGDVDGDGADELIRTWPENFEGSHECTVAVHVPNNDRFNRNLQVYQLRKDEATWPGGGGLIVGFPDPYETDGGLPYGGQSYADRLAAGDLDRDLQEEFAWHIGIGMHDTDGTRILRTYDYDDPDWGTTEVSMPLDTYPSLVTGDFTGESVRVGPPSYRVQNRVDTLVTVINMPPKHRDLVKDSAGVYHEIVSPDETCWPTAGDPRCTHAKYATEEFESSQQTIQTTHAYTVSAGMEQKVCAGGGMGDLSLKACVTGSIDTTHGGNFEKTTDTISSTKYETTVLAASDDQLVFYGTPYAVWEYPILTGSTPESDGFITIAFPLIAQTQFPGDLGGYLNGTCNKNWYTPGHQLNNVWSYDPFTDPPAFGDYDPAYDPIYYATKGDFTSGAITYSDFESVKDSSTFNHGISAGMKYEGEAKANLGIVNLETSLKLHAKGSYAFTSMDTDVFTTKDGTTYSYFIGPQPVGSKFQTRVVFYWAQNGYQALNYQTEPGTSGSWGYYDKADPAFILPWYGFPDPATGQFPNPPNTDAPPCGFENQLFSPDVQVNPVYAGVGETVEISATIRNFSNVAPGQVVTVKFYQGDPSLNVVIGQDTITGLSRQSGPQTAHITWTASGAGRQKIFAVIDPDGNLPEVHDEDDFINNNVAFNTLEIGSSTFVDQDMVAQQPYQSQNYSQSDDLQVSFYLPPGNLEAVSRFDLMDSSQSATHAVGRTFELVAYQGSKSDTWDEAIPDFDLRPVDGDPPAVIAVAYSEADIAGHNEADLNLYQLTFFGWEKANLLCGIDYDGELYEVSRFPQDNLLFVPVCQTGVFALSDEKPDFTFNVYMPFVNRQ